jgi:hypothetical protein
VTRALPAFERHYASVINGVLYRREAI